MDTLVIILIILLVVFGFGGVYTGRAGYAGPGAGLRNFLYIIGVIVIILIILRLVGIWV